MNSAFSRFASAETELLACCARTFVSPEMAARIREVAAGPLDWESAFAWAEDQSIFPLLARNLRTFAAGAIPADVAAKVDAGIRENAVRCLAQASELIRIVDQLASSGIRVLPYKGAVIAAQAYQDVCARQFDDLDIILQQRDIRAADEAVRALGYEPRSAWLLSGNGRGVVPGEYSYAHPARRITLELHTEATLRHFPVVAPVAEFLGRAVAVDLGGARVETFCAEDALIVYCIHATKDFWRKLVWTVDIAEMLRAFSNLDWDSVWRTSERLRARRMVHLGLALAASIVGAPLPTEVRAQVEGDERASGLARGIAKGLVSSAARQRSAVERFLYRRRTVQGFSAGWRYALRLALAPAEEDWSGTELRSPGSPLHKALRPLRLLRKY